MIVQIAFQKQSSWCALFAFFNRRTKKGVRKRTPFQYFVEDYSSISIILKGTLMID
jgi:hypothetical protein